MIPRAPWKNRGPKIRKIIGLVWGPSMIWCHGARYDMVSWGPESLAARPAFPAGSLCRPQAPQCNGAPVAEYRLEWGAAEGSMQTCYSGPALSYEVRGLQPATFYFCRVQVGGLVLSPLLFSAAPGRLCVKGRALRHRSDL